MSSTILTQQQQTVLELLKEPIQKNGFYMAGGTALALQFNHRRSVDFDFFRERSFDTAFLRMQIHGAEIVQESKGTLTVLIQEVKVSFFEFNYPLLQPLHQSFVIPLAHVDDIAAMKISAIAGRGSKRDFVDLHAIAHRGHSLAACIELFNKKFGDVRVDSYHIMKSLIYFEDAENEEMPEMISRLQWKEVKEFFKLEVNQLVKQ